MSNKIKLNGYVMKYPKAKKVKVYKFIRNELNDKDALNEIQQHLRTMNDEH